MPINIISPELSSLSEELAYKLFDIGATYIPFIAIPFLFIIVKNTKNKKIKYAYLVTVLISSIMMYLSQIAALEMLGIAMMKLISLYDEEPVNRSTTYSFLSLLIIFYAPFSLSVFLFIFSAINDISLIFMALFSFLKNNLNQVSIEAL